MKIDVLALEESQIKKELEYLRHYDVKVIAEKVETQEMGEIKTLQDFYDYIIKKLNQN